MEDSVNIENIFLIKLRKVLKIEENSPIITVRIKM